jgi:aminopeptidase YwaD
MPVFFSRRLRLMGALLLLAAVLGAGCGGSTPERTPTLAPTARPTATAEPSPGPPEPSGERALAHVEALALDIGPRPAGSEEEAEAVAYLVAQFEDYGYSVEVEDFSFAVSAGLKVALAVTQPEEQIIWATPLVGSAPGSASAELADVGTGRAEDYPQAGLAGAVALVQGGEEASVMEIAASAVAADASAVIISSGEPDLLATSMEEPVSVPIVAIPQESGEDLRALLAEGSVAATVGVGPFEGTAHNVVARPASGRCETLSGAHHDSTPASPGANDNASGAAVVLELARATAAAGLPGDHCFAIFGAEEIGLQGSAFFVSQLSAEERSALRLMLNFDVVGGGAEGLRLQDGSELTAEVLGLAEAAGLAAPAGEMPPGFISDHSSFREADIPAIWFATPPFDRINSPLDTFEQVDAASLDEALRLGFLLLSEFGQP